MRVQAFKWTGPVFTCPLSGGRFIMPKHVVDTSPDRRVARIFYLRYLKRKGHGQKRKTICISPVLPSMQFHLAKLKRLRLPLGRRVGAGVALLAQAPALAAAAVAAAAHARGDER